jgi:hypothetical protein
MWDTAELTEPAVRIHDRLASFGNVLLRPFELPYVSCSSYRCDIACDSPRVVSGAALQLVASQSTAEHRARHTQRGVLARR